MRKAALARLWGVQGGKASGQGQGGRGPEKLREGGQEGTKKHFTHPAGIAGPWTRCGKGVRASCPGAWGYPWHKGLGFRCLKGRVEENVFRYPAHRGRYRPPCCGRRASDLGRLVPSRSKGLSAAPQRRGWALSLGFRVLGFTLKPNN